MGNIMYRYNFRLNCIPKDFRTGVAAAACSSFLSWYVMASGCFLTTCLAMSCIAVYTLMALSMEVFRQAYNSEREQLRSSRSGRLDTGEKKVLYFVVPKEDASQ